MSLAENVFELYQGEARSIDVVLKDAGSPFDLTGASEIAVKFPKPNGDFLGKTLTVGDVQVMEAKLGKINVTLETSDILAMNIADFQNFHAVVTIGSAIRVIEFFNSLTVREP